MIRLNARRGFTLIEMLVVMALIATLAAMAMVVVPGIMDKDRSVDTATNVQSWLQIAQARAQRDRLPRGVRLIVDLNKPYPGAIPPIPTSPVDERLYATEAQYIESPPVFVANPSPNAPTNAGAYVDFIYTVGSNPQPGSIASRACQIRGLTQDQRDQIINSALNNAQPSIWLPVLGTWHRILSATANTLSGVDVVLDSYPDAQLGASTSYRTYHFGIYGPPRPLLGEPAMQLPTNTCVDLYPNVSQPGVTAPFQTPAQTPQDYDILFAPNGHLAYTASTAGNGHVFLCVRDWRKLLKLSSPVAMDLTNTALVQQGGEMMIIAIKAKSGAIGVAPVDQSGDPYALARQAVAGP